MYHLFGTHELVKNKLVLGLKFSCDRPKTMIELEKNFHAFLKDYQPNVPRADGNSTQIINHAETELKLADLFRTDSMLNDRNQSNLIESRYQPNEYTENEHKLKKTLSTFKKQIPEFYELFNLTIDSLFMRHSKDSGGGSTSNAVGVIWINYRTHWSEQDLIELLVHELTHNLVFIDELRHLHFTNYKEIALEENFAKSAILHIKRPIDKVFHSIVVATEVLLLRRNHLGEPQDPKVHPPSDKMLRQTRESLDSLRELPKYETLLTTRGKMIIQKCDDHLKMIENELISMKWKPTT
jgi:hypothetical protein